MLLIGCNRMCQCQPTIVTILRGAIQSIRYAAYVFDIPKELVAWGEFRADTVLWEFGTYGQIPTTNRRKRTWCYCPNVAPGRNGRKVRLRITYYFGAKKCEISTRNVWHRRKSFAVPIVCIFLAACNTYFGYLWDKTLCFTTFQT